MPNQLRPPQANPRGVYQGVPDPPPLDPAWQKALRGDYYSVRDQWVSFDPQLYHCVEPVAGGDRRSLALFTSRTWKRILPSHSLEELMEIGFFPPFMTQSAEATAPALLVSPISSPVLADRLKEDDELALKGFRSFTGSSNASYRST